MYPSNLYANSKFAIVRLGKRAALVVSLCISGSLSLSQNLPDRAAPPPGPEAQAISLGKELIADTRHRLPANVGNGLNCTNCHLDAGTRAWASPWTGLTGAFPEYRARTGRLISLQERINDCFERSMNGKPLGWNSTEMNAILAYIRWLSNGVETGKPIHGRGFIKFDTQLVPDPVKGEKIFANRCAACHGRDGQGLRGGGDAYIFPPLWGKDSFNVGAGMARYFTAAAFVLKNMPPGQEGSLTPQEALDVSSFFTQQPRPDFPGKSADWPNSNKPADARY